MELMRIKKGVASLAIAGTLLGTSAVGALAAPPASNGPQSAANSAVITETVRQLGLVNASGIQVGLVNVDKSLNSLQILNNVLNNNDIIDDITVGDINVVRIRDITLTDVLTNFLNANQIAINDVVGVAVLSGGDLIVFTR
jgi:hypothetical protein